MPSLADVAGHRSALEDLSTLAQAALLDLWASLDTSDAAAASAALQAALPDLVALYGTAAGSLAADWYDDLRERAGIARAFSAEPVEAAAAEQVRALARWGVGPLFGADANEQTALGLLAGGVQRLVVNTDRLTIAANVQRDPAGARFVRVARPDACAFCRLLSSRGAAYTSKEAALSVGGGARVRGSRAVGSKFHDRCGCTVAPEWDDAPVELPAYARGWEAAYYRAANATTAPGKAVDLSAVLGYMRTDLGAR